MLFDHQNLAIDISYSLCADITYNGRYMTQYNIFGNGGTFCPGLPFSDHFDKGITLWMFIFFSVTTKQS